MFATIILYRFIVNNFVLTRENVTRDWSIGAFGKMRYVIG